MFSSRPFAPIPQLRGSMIEISRTKIGKCKTIKKFYISVGKMRVIGVSSFSLNLMTGLQGQGATLFGAPQPHYDIEEVRLKWEELTK